MIMIIASIFLFAGIWVLWNRMELGKLGKQENVATPAENPYKDAEIEVVIIPAENDIYGYDIYVYGAVLIHQPSRPRLPGNAGFATEADAMKAAELGIKKIRQS